MCTTAFASTAKVPNAGENKYKSIRLTPEIYNNANADLSDIIIKDNSGENAPYFINYAQREAYNYSPKFTVEENGNKTVISIEGVKNLRLRELTLKTDSIFKRVVSTPFGINKELYHLQFGDEINTDTTLDLSGQISREPSLILTINNNDDKPIKISDIALTYDADELVFEGNGSLEYTVYFGEDYTKTAPVYDIVNYKDEILKGAVDRLTIKEVVITDAPKQEQEQEQPPFDYRLVFNIIIVVVALVLAAVILLKLGKEH